MPARARRSIDPYTFASRTLTLAAAALLCTSPAFAQSTPRGADAPPPAADQVNLDVTRIAIFNSGVGYFECDARVSGEATAELKFRTDQINDILKSLVVMDMNGGSVSAVSYASRDPIEKTLRSFGVDITGKPSLAQLLDQLRGEPVEISGARAMRGVILGVEKKKIAVERETIEIDVLNLMTDEGLQQVELRQVEGIRLLNAGVREELRKALETLATSHDANKKSVTLRFSGQGERRVRAAYLLEAPIWKTSYRLVLEEEAKPFLQGWATVENATEEDWNNVRLSLVSGRPISFRMDLYTPLYVPRPLEQLEIYASLRPPEFEGGFAAEKAKAPAEAAAPAPAMRPQSRSGAVAGRREMEMDELKDAALGEEQAGLDLRGSGIESVASAQEAGELFEYQIRTPVTIPRQHSAMLPIVNDEVTGEKVSIFNPATHPKHPLNGLELTNSTKLNLMQGPVTLFDGNVYAGDAKFPDMKPGEKRLLAYALDLATEVLTRHKSHPSELVSLRISRGVLYHRHRYIDERDYDIKNKDDKARTVIIEQPFSDDWTLIEPKEPYERTQSLLRFKLSVPAGKTVTQNVKLERIGDETIMLSEAGFDAIRIYLRAPVISPRVKEALERVIALRAELDNLARRRALLEQQVNEAVAEQTRLRENLKALPAGSDQYKRQLTKFDEFETQIGNTRTELAKAREAEEAKRKELEEYLLNLEVE